MFASSFIDTVIGISFVFLLLSLIASTVNELILASLNMRAKDLLRGLKTLLNDTNATGLVDKVYNHGQIFGLFEGDFDAKKTGNLPSYIPSSNFASALLEVVREAASPAGGNQQAGAEAAQQGAGEAHDQDRVAVIQRDASAIVKAIREGAQKLAEDKTTAKVGKPILCMIDVAGNDLTKLGKGVENWYNSAMDRVSGWYKHRTQRILFFIGLGLAMALNADTVRIVKQISNDPTLRQSIVAAAQSAKPPESQAGQFIGDKIQAVHDDVAKLQNIGIPLGWNGAWLPSGSTEDKAWGWSRIAAGWILTAVAVSLGAPFWFDTLNKFMVVRSTVKPREKSQEEGAKDKK